MPGPEARRTNVLAGCTLVVAALALIVWRGTQYLVAPSFWAEDGALFFAGAWNSGPLAGLVQRPSGYLNLYANVATSMAAWLAGSGAISLVAAPRVTAVAGLLAQLVPITLLAFATAPAWGGWLRRAIAIAVVLFGTRTGGMWLNAVNAQYFLALGAVVVLLEPAHVRAGRRWLHAAVVALAQLAGPVACFLTPLFVWTAARTRTRSAMLLAGIALLCTGLQLWLIALAGPGLVAARAQSVSIPALAAVVWARTIVLPVLGSPAASWLVGRVRPMLVPIETPAAFVVAGLLLLSLALGIAVLALGTPRDVRWRLVGAYALVTLGSFVGAVGGASAMLGGMEAGARYAFVPGVLVLWLLLLNVRPGRRAQALACAVLLVLGLAPSAWQWRSTLRWRASWPVWSAQVAAWTIDPRTPLRIWPSGWTMRLVRPAR